MPNTAGATQRTRRARLRGLIRHMDYYVDNAASGSGHGTSWSDAWTSFSAINWSAIRPGDTIYVSGGASSQTYNETLTVGASGSASADVTITKGTDPGHNGKVVI